MSPSYRNPSVAQVPELDRGGLAGQGAVRPLVVVEVGEGVQEGLELGEVCGLGRLGGEPVFEGLLEPLYLALGLGMAGFPVFLLDAQAAQLGFQAVAAAFAAGEAGGEDHPVVCQR
jgi:hypothetical protein